MREIKFRAWDKEAKEMVVLFGIQWGKDIGGGLYIDPEEGTTLIPDDTCELMQYTGLKDKNGKEIYEGDIYAANKRYPYEVYWNKNTARFLLRGVFNGKNQGITTQKNGEVIGNIYENPDLLK